MGCGLALSVSVKVCTLNLQSRSGLAPWSLGTGLGGHDGLEPGRGRSSVPHPFRTRSGLHDALSPACQALTGLGDAHGCTPGTPSRSMISLTQLCTSGGWVLVRSVNCSVQSFVGI